MNADKLAAAILDQLKGILRGRWAKFNAEQRQILADVAHDAADVSLRSLAGILTPEKQQRARKNITAQVANLKSAGEGAVIEDFWTAVRLAVRGGLAIVLA